MGNLAKQRNFRVLFVLMKPVINSLAFWDGKQTRMGFVAVSVLLTGLIFVCACQFPYKIDPSGSCLFVKNEDYTQPELQNPFVSQPGTRPFESTAPSETPTITATTTPAYQSTLPGVSATPGTAVGISPSATSSNAGLIRGASPTGASTLLVPGSGPIVLVTPEEQIALIGTEIILFANYKGDDDYLRIGERIEWSLGGVGHIQTTNKTQCGNVLALDFNRDKKLSDRFAVTSTLHYEGTIDRGSADEQGVIPHLAGQSWVSVRSAEEGTSTVTAYAPTIKDWNRRTSSAVVHWIDAEWVYPRPDVTKYNEPKVFVTKVKKRSSGSPCPGWVVRYEITGGPNAGLGTNRSQTLDVTTNESGDASVDLHLLEGNSGTSTVKATIIRPSGVDGGTKRLELHSSNLTNVWSIDSPLRMQTILPKSRWGENVACVINVANSSTVSKSGVVSLPLPNYMKLISSEPRPTSQVAQDDGGQLVTWQVQDFKGQHTTQIKLVLQSMTSDTALMSQPLEVELNPQLTMFPAQGSQSGTSTGTSSGGSGLSTTGDSGTSGGGFGGSTGTLPTTPAPEYSGTQTPPTFVDGTRPSRPRPGDGTGSGTTPGRPRPGANNQGHSDPNTFANQIKVDVKVGALMSVNQINYADVAITNNASIPFYQGKVHIGASEGFGFIEQGQWIIDPQSGKPAAAVEFQITDASQNITAIQPGKTHTLRINVSSQRPGTGTLTVSVLGAAENTEQFSLIPGAQGTANCRAGN